MKKLAIIVLKVYEFFIQKRPQQTVNEACLIRAVLKSRNEMEVSRLEGSYRTYIGG